MQPPKPTKPTKQQEDDKFWNIILGLLLVLVSFMLYNEVMRHYQYQQQIFWDDHYLAAVRSDPNDWKFGWRLEDLEQRMLSQRRVLELQGQTLDTHELGLARRMSEFLHSFQQHQDQHHPPLLRSESNQQLSEHSRQVEEEKLAKQLFRFLENDTAFHTVSCAAREHDLLRVGPDDFRDVKTDRCKVFSVTTMSDLVGPHAIWEVVDLGDDAVGLRALANGKFLKVVAPDSETEWNAAWKTEVVSPLPGLAERFRIVGNLIYSELMHGYLQCDGGGALTMAVKGYPGDTLYEESDIYHFTLSRLTPRQLQHARQLRDASVHTEYLQTKQLSSHLSLLKSSGELDAEAQRQARKLREGYHVALVVPMTSRGTDMSAVDQSPFWFNLFASFMESIDWRTNPHTFTFYVGFDLGDPLYDTGDAWGDFRDAFARNTRRALTWLDFGNITDKVLDKQLHLKLKHFDDTVGAPSQAVVGLVRQAYDDGNDYFFQVNDDTVVVSKGWTDSFIKALSTNPLFPNLGVTGPVDTNNDRILTHAFTHRTHIEIFGAFFPPAFKNWWSDDWISTVYGALHTFRMYDVLVTHNVQSQKTGSFNRYSVDESAQYRLRNELSKGFVKINAWLKERGKLPMPLPSVCGYSPLMGELYPSLVKLATKDEKDEL